MTKRFCQLATFTSFMLPASTYALAIYQAAISTIYHASWRNTNCFGIRRILDFLDHRGHLILLGAIAVYKIGAWSSILSD